MTQAMPDDLWRDFPKTATAFETRFATEEDCRAYWIAARWGGEVKAKYRDSKTGETWSGRGRMATWLKRKQNAGEDVDDYLV
jgi:DNA-binding protein H-NS